MPNMIAHLSVPAPRNVYLIANNPSIGYADLRRTENDLIVRFNTCTPPSDRLFGGHTDVLILRSKGISEWHGVDDSCHLACSAVMQQETHITMLGGDRRCISAWPNAVNFANAETCVSLRLSPCPEWGLHTGTQAAMKYRRKYPFSNIYLLGFTFHSEQFNDQRIHHDGLQEKKLLVAYNVTVVEQLHQ